MVQFRQCGTEMFPILEISPGDDIDAFWAEVARCFEELKLDRVLQAIREEALLVRQRECPDATNHTGNSSESDAAQDAASVLSDLKWIDAVGLERMCPGEALLRGIRLGETLVRMNLRRFEPHVARGLRIVASASVGGKARSRAAGLSDEKFHRVLKDAADLSRRTGLSLTRARERVAKEQGTSLRAVQRRLSKERRGQP